MQLFHTACSLCSDHCVPPQRDRLSLLILAGVQLQPLHAVARGFTLQCSYRSEVEGRENPVLTFFLGVCFYVIVMLVVCMCYCYVRDCLCYCYVKCLFVLLLC